MGRPGPLGPAAVCKAVKVYPVPVVGEAKYQMAISLCREGEPVRICHETGNPFDELALRVETSEGETIGYIAKSSWLREAIHDQGRGTAASIRSINSGGEGMLGVVLDVTLTDDAVLDRRYGEEAAADTGDGPDIADKRESIQRLLLQLARVSNVPISCDCGRTYSVGFAQFRSGVTVGCKVCRRSDTVTDTQAERIENEFITAARKLLAHADMPVPHRADILGIARGDGVLKHRPTTTERGFIIRLLRRRPR